MKEYLTENSITAVDLLGQHIQKYTSSDSPD